MTDSRVTCYLMGEESLLVQCGEILRAANFHILGVIAENAQIREWARALDIETLDPRKDLHGPLSRTTFDYFFSIANLRMVPEAVLDLARKLSINFHDGLLPGYAGTYATTWALMNREAAHGITWHEMLAGPDRGRIILQKSFELANDDNALSLNTKCFEAAIEGFRDVVSGIRNGGLSLIEQDFSKRTYYGFYDRPAAQGMVPWSKSAEDIDAFMRSLEFGSYTNPLASAKTSLGGEILIVEDLAILDSESTSPPGTLLAWDEAGVVVSTGSRDVCCRRVRTLDGTHAEPGPAVGKFELPESEFGQFMGELNERAARHEAFWVRRLSRLQSLDLPYFDRTKRTERPREFRDMELPCAVEHALEFFPLFLARSSGQGRFDVSYHKRLRTEHGAVFSPWVPLRFDLRLEDDATSGRARVAKQFLLADKKETFARDVMVRFPQLRGGKSSAVAVARVDELNDLEATSDQELLVSFADGHMRWSFDPGMISPERIEAMQEQFLALVAQLAESEEIALSRVSLLSAKERQRVLADWNQTAVPYSQHVCIHHLFEAQVKAAPDSVALVHGNQELTYRELNVRVNRMAHHLIALGVGPDGLVGVLTQRSIDMVVATLGVHKAGGAYVPLDPEYPVDRLAFMVEDADIQVLISQSELVEMLPEYQGPVVLTDDCAALEDSCADTNPTVAMDADRLAYVIYTSGSTGKPKGVMVEHRNAINFFVGMDERIEHDLPCTWLAVTSLSFDISVLEIFYSLTRGFKIVLYSGDDKNGVDDASIAQLIGRHDVTHFQCTPSMASMLMASEGDRKALASVPSMFVGGEAMPVALAQGLSDTVGMLMNMYGPTETTIWSSTQVVTPDMETISIGTPIANTEIYILDENLEPVPAGSPGELCIGGDGVVRGYLNREELTRDRFVPDHLSGRENARIYRTGDLARHRSDGVLEFLGRMDHQVKIRGYRIELGEIEARLVEHDAVREAVVIAREDNPGDKRLVAYLLGANQSVPGARELREHLKENLPVFMVPSAFVPMSEFPLTPNLKVDRKALPSPEEVRARAKAEVPPVPSAPPANGDMSSVIGGIWRQALNVERIGLSDNFFDLGGHSLLMVQVHSQLKDAISTELSLVDLFRFPTIASLVKHIEGASKPELAQANARSGKRKGSLAQRRKMRKQRKG